MREKITNPHDAFFKHYLSQPAVAIDFLRQHLPTELTALLDLGQLRLEKDTFVDEKLRNHFSDLIYTTTTRFNTPIRVAFLAEHKSYPDEWVNFQVLRYKVGHWVQEFDARQTEQGEPASLAEDNNDDEPADQAKQARTKRRNTLTPIIVLLVYHGVEAWRNPLRFARHLTS